MPRSPLQECNAEGVYKEFTEKLLVYGFLQSNHDYCLFSYQEDDEVVFLLVYMLMIS